MFRIFSQQQEVQNEWESRQKPWEKTTKKFAV